MQLALVQGNATATIRHPTIRGQKLLLCQQLDAAGKPGGDPVLVIDQLGAGAGDVVMITSDGKGLRELLKADNSPARWWTLAIVDPAPAEVNVAEPQR
jgi:ethanolamine utilization protein EutN